MTTQKLNYILMSVLLAVALLAGYFGITLPIQPEIPDPLPPADLAPLEGQLAAVAQRVDDLERDALAGDSGNFDFSTRYNVPCYQAQGGANWVAGDGCTWTIGDGATLEIISGSTVSLFNLITSTLDGLTVNGTAEITGDLDVGEDLTVGGALTVTGEIQYGANALYPLGVGLPGFQIGGGRAQITGTQVFTHATGTAWVTLCAMETLTATAGACGIERGVGAVTLTVYTVPTLTVATTPAWVNWLIMGQP